MEGNGASMLRVSSLLTVIFSGLSIEDGSISLIDGGGIANSGTLTVEGSTISDNAAQYAGSGFSRTPAR